MVPEKRLKAAKIGVELFTYDQTAGESRNAAREMADVGRLEDGSEPVRNLRLAKSAVEVIHMREAGHLSHMAAHNRAKPGICSGELSGLAIPTVPEQGGDLPAGSKRSDHGRVRGRPPPLYGLH
ncbi:hypothetical protein [Falsigemmobacter faecalis]|uniref:Uncharacterized protein n=1 Tax=Falsigemmobacter faecalis TaxID=2488730 RepID=A0A3P3DPK8_9RHOB|nr:hypothetical protein [Falsigemmobacter faecalis]RRH76193.1 hypothetical protein EG244_07185 [Falsigemmobacter faecalis]